MRQRSSRGPSLWLVLLPGLVLALLGARAVMGEVDRERERSRARALEAAQRLAKAVDRLVEEFAAPLPGVAQIVTEAQALDRTRHLRPRWAYDREGRYRELAAPDAVSGADAALLAEVLRRTDDITDPRDAVFGAALCGGAAEAVEDARSAAFLRARALDLDLLAGDVGHALRMMDRGAAGGGAEGLDERLAAWLTAGDGEALRVEDLSTVYAFVASDRSGIEEPARSALLDRIESVANGAPLPTGVRARRDALRTAARTMRAPPAITMDHGAGEEGLVRIALNRMVRLGSRERFEHTVIGGEIPAAAVHARLVEEARELAADPALMDAYLVGPDGRLALDPGRADHRYEGLDDLRAVVPLGRELGDWRAEAIAERPRGLPPMALLLGLAVLLTSGALAWGGVALKRAAERNARLAEERRTFLDHVAHEVRTPASALLVLSEELAAGHVPESERGEYHGHMLRESNRLARLVEETLDLARLDESRLVFRPERVDLREIVREAVSTAASGRIVVATPDDEVAVLADRASIERSVRNLVENALGHGGGGPVRVELAARNGTASVTVADAGPGVPPDHRDRIFERFYRVPSATHDVKGVGLGLALCRETARAHGGDVRLLDSAGPGAVFSLTLPVAERRP